MNRDEEHARKMPTREDFAGLRLRSLGEAASAGHVLTLAEYVFPDGSVEPYLEVSERHPWYSGSRRIAVSTAVHALLNLGQMELFQVAERASDFQGVATEPA